MRNASYNMVEEEHRRQNSVLEIPKVLGYFLLVPFAFLKTRVEEHDEYRFKEQA